jgi:hypothetical protein
MTDKSGNKYQYPLPEATYRGLAQKLYAPLKLGENSIVICPPLYGRDHNVMQIWQRPFLIDDTLALFKNRFSFYLFEPLNTEKNPENLWLAQLEQILQLSKAEPAFFDNFKKNIKELITEGKEIVLIVNIPETFSDEVFASFLELCQKIYYISPARIHFLMFFDIKWDEETFINLIMPYRSLFQNIHQAALYTDIEVEHFIKHLLDRWETKLNKKAIHYIVSQAGGILLFAKAIVRIAIKENIKTPYYIEKIIPNHEEYILQIKFFHSRLTQSQQNILSCIANNQEIEDTVEVSHLIKMGIVENSINGFFIRSKALEQFLSKDIRKTNVITVNIRNDSGFSTREKKILLSLLDNSGQTVEREAVAKIFWGKDMEEKYSDWAIDKAVSRIRSKLKNNRKFAFIKITTHKKLGFSLEKI